MRNSPLYPIAGAGAICIGSARTLTDSTTGGTWSSSATGVATVSATGAVTGLAAGSAIITYSVTGGFDTALVTVNTTPIVTVTPVASTICSGNTSNMTASGATSYTWSPSVGLSASTGATVTFNGLTTSTYTVIGTTTGCSGTRTQTITVSPTPTVTVTPVASIICSGTTTNMTASGATSYTWSPSTGLSSSTGATVTFNGLTTSTYTVTGTTTGCSAAASQTITVNPTPTITVTPVASTICVGTTLNLTASGATTFTWSPSTGLSATTGATVTFNGTTTATYTVTAALSGCSGNAVAAVTVNNQATWIGSTSNDWFTPSNWDCGSVPTASLNALIPAGTTYQPLIVSDSNAFVKDLALNLYSALYINDRGTLQIKGSLNNNSKIAGGGEVKLNGTLAQSVSGIGSIKRLELNNTNGASISSVSRLTIDSVLTITTGTLTTNDSLVIGADTLNAARVAPIGATGAIAGKARVLQTIQSGFRRYRFMAHPFSDTLSLSQMQNYIDITGIGGNRNGFTSTATNMPSAFRYNTYGGNSTLGYDPGWKPFTNILPSASDTNQLHRYEGIRVFTRGAKGQGLDGNPYTVRATVIGQFGHLNQGRQAMRLKKGAGTGQAYNLVGNPYASPVDIGTPLFNAKVSGNIIGAFYIWDPTLGAGGQFVSYPISTVSPTPYYIQACGAFEFQAAHDGDSVVFNETDKHETASANLLRLAPEYTTLYVYDENYHLWDLLRIQFDSASSDVQDQVNDADKLIAGADLDFYSLSSDGKRLSVDSRPYHADEVIRLGITSNYAQDFIIRAENVTAPPGSQLYLHDKWLGKYTEMSQGAEYRFTITKDKAAQGNSRFELTMKPQVVTSEAVAITLSPNPSTDEAVVTFSDAPKGEISIRVTNISGVTVFTKTCSQCPATIVIPTRKLVPGMYTVEITTPNGIITKRLVKQ